MNKGEASAEAKHFCTEVNEHGEVCGGQLDFTSSYMIDVYPFDDEISSYPCMKCGRLYRYKYPYHSSGKLIPAFRIHRAFYTDEPCEPYFLIEYQGRKIPDYYWGEEDKKNGKSNLMRRREYW